MDITKYDGSCHDWTALVGAAKTGDFGDDKKQPFRSLAWKIFCGFIPGNLPFKEWKHPLAIARKLYSNVRAEHIPDFSTVVHDPLSLAADSNDGSVWNVYSQMAELRAEIQRDLDRLFIDGSPEKFFMDSDRQNLMRTVLYIWSRRNYPLPSYRQGMHELLGFILYVCETDTDRAIPPSEDKGNRELLRDYTDRNHLEADVFILFESIMREMKPWFQVHTPPKKSPAHLGGGSTPDSKQQPVLMACENMQGARLLRGDPTLAKHLMDIEFSPQLYGLRWLRLLFGREFSMPDTLLIWDALFAVSAFKKGNMNDGSFGLMRCSLPAEYEKSVDSACLLVFAECLGTAMIRSVRDQILHDDGPNGAMMALMKFKSPVPPAMIIARALEVLRMSSINPSEMIMHNHADNGSDDPLLQPGKSAQSKAPSWFMSNVASQVSTKGYDLLRRNKSAQEENSPAVIGTPYNVQHDLTLKGTNGVVEPLEQSNKVVLVSPSAVSVIVDDQVDNEAPSSNALSADELVSLADHIKQSISSLAGIWANHTPSPNYHTSMPVTSVREADNDEENDVEDEASAQSREKAELEEADRRRNWYGNDDVAYDEVIETALLNSSSHGVDPFLSEQLPSPPPIDVKYIKPSSKTKELELGDDVQIRPLSIAEAEELQQGHGGLATAMQGMLGSFGKIEAVWSNGQEVTVGGRTWSKELIRRRIDIEDVGNEEDKGVDVGMVTIKNEANDHVGFSNELVSANATAPPDSMMHDLDIVRAALNDLAEVEGILRNQVKLQEVKWQLSIHDQLRTDDDVDDSGDVVRPEGREDGESLFVSSPSERGTLISTHTSTLPEIDPDTLFTVPTPLVQDVTPMKIENNKIISKETEENTNTVNEQEEEEEPSRRATLEDGFVITSPAPSSLLSAASQTLLKNKPEAKGNSANTLNSLLDLNFDDDNRKKTTNKDLFG